MSLRNCLPGLVADGKMSEEHATEMRGLFDELQQNFKRQFGDQAADAMASDATIAAMRAESLRRRQIATGQIKAQQAMLHDIRMNTRDGEPLNPKRAEHQIYRAEARRLAIRSRSFSMLNGILDSFHSNAFGFARNKAQLRDVVRELFGEHSGNAAAGELAQAWTRTADMLRQRFNAAGGSIGKLENWGLPQSHDTQLVRDAGYQGWRDTIAPLLDRQKMVDRLTGMLMSPQKLELALRDVYQTISTDGWNGRSAGSAGGGALANRSSDARFLHFKDADSWMAYQEKFGAANAFNAMMNHIEGMSRDVGLMEVLGPNPNASLKWLKDTITKSGAEDMRPKNMSGQKAFASSKQINRLYAEITGADGRPENKTVALTFSNFRAVQTAAKLGGAVLKKPVEFATQYMTRVNNGVATLSMIPQIVDAIRPFHDKQWLIGATGIAEEASSRYASTVQTLGETLTNSIAQRLAAGTVRLSGLSRFTEANRWAAGMGFVHEITNMADRGFDELRPALRRSLERQGIDATGWNSIRATEMEQHKGTGWLLPRNVEDHDLGDKLYGAIHHMVDLSVPAPTLAVKTWINSKGEKGTWGGELIRSMGQFKAFPISIVAQHMGEIMEHYTAGRTWHAVGYAAGLFTTTMMMGALTLQLEALKRGEDPRDMSELPHMEEQPDGTRTLKMGFWTAASLQGGGWGLMGDFLHSTENHFGGGIPGAIAGPLISDVGNLAVALHAQHPAWTLAHNVVGDLPGQSLWYSKLAFQRLVIDQAQSMLDPNYQSSWARMEQRARDERSAYWWHPGETAPARAPSFGNIDGGPADQDGAQQAPP